MVSRIHVADIVSVVESSIERPEPGMIMNVADDLPSTRYEVTAFMLIFSTAPYTVSYTYRSMYDTLFQRARLSRTDSENLPPKLHGVPGETYNEYVRTNINSVSH